MALPICSNQGELQAAKIQGGETGNAGGDVSTELPGYKEEERENGKPVFVGRKGERRQRGRERKKLNEKNQNRHLPLIIGKKKVTKMQT